MKLKVAWALWFSILLLCSHRGLAWTSSVYPESWTPPENALFYSDKLIQDFSYAGYRRGEEALPEITGPVFDAVAYGADSSGTSDSTAAIQAAIDAAEAAGGGVVYLQPGTYDVEPIGANNYALRIRSSDIVLRGAGVGQTYILNTSYEMRGKSVIRISPSSTTAGSAVLTTSDLLNPTRRIPVADASAFNVGDIVQMEWTFTQEWINEHDQGTWWSAGSGPASAKYLREVTAVDTVSGWIEVDIPTRYTMKTRDNAQVSTVSGMLSNVGVEDLSIGNVQHPGSGFGSTDYTNSGTAGYDAHASWLIRVEDTYDSWITDVESFQTSSNTSTCHMLSNGILLLSSFRNTVADCVMQRSQYGGGGGNAYMYRFQYAQDNLIKDCTAEFSRHGFVISHAGTSGNVFLRCDDRETKRSTGSSGSYTTSGSGSDHHMHFSHSNLFDQCSVYNSFYTASHRGTSGTVPHGLSSAHGVYWNTSGSGSRYSTIVESEQARYGYVIGTSGSSSGASISTGGNTAPADILEGLGSGNTLEPQSLYTDQLAKRMQGLLLFMEEDATLGITAAHPLNPSVYNYASGEAIYAWSQISGPATTFDDPSSASTTVTLPTEGTYVFELTADNGITSVSDQITLTVVGVVVEPLTNDASFVSVDEILGRSENTTTNPTGYYTDSSNQTVGATGSSGSRTDSNVVYRYALPTLPAGEVISGFTISYQITAIRDQSNDDYELDTYLLDTSDPTGTGTDLYYHGPNDIDHALAGSHFEFSGSVDGSITLPEPVDVILTIDSGEALELLQTYYTGSQPSQSEVALRFNLDQDFGSLSGQALNRYILSNDVAETGFVVLSKPGTFNDWVASYDLGGLTAAGQDADKDGIANIVEAWFGTDPTAPSVGLSNPTTNGTVTTFTHRKNLRPPSDLSGAYEWSPNLVDWYPSFGGPDGGPTVEISSSTSVDSIATVTASASEALPQLFVRIVVSRN